MCLEDDTDLWPIESDILGQFSYNNKTVDSSDVCTISEWMRVRPWRTRGVKESQATSEITVWEGEGGNELVMKRFFCSC